MIAEIWGTILYDIDTILYDTIPNTLSREQQERVAMAMGPMVVMATLSYELVEFATWMGPEHGQSLKNMAGRALEALAMFSIVMGLAVVCVTTIYLVKRVMQAARFAALRAASDAAGPAPVILTKEQQAAKRAALLNRLAALPDHLRLWAWRCPVCASC